jgi:hypothetical protein
MRRGEWVARVRADPKTAMEADLVIAVVGVITIVVGGLVAVAGVHNRTSNDNAGNPILGNIIAAIGVLAILLGLILAIANVVVWLTGRSRGNQARPQTADERLLQNIRDEGRGAGPPEPLRPPPAPRRPPSTAPEQAEGPVSDERGGRPRR